MRHLKIIYVERIIYLREINFRRDYFFVWKFRHISHGFIFVDGKILIILCGRIFAVSKYLISLSIIFQKIAKSAKINPCEK